MSGRPPMAFDQPTLSWSRDHRSTVAECCAAVCDDRPDLVVGGLTAAQLWGFRGARRDGCIHVILPPTSEPCLLRGVKGHRTTSLTDDDVVVRDDGIRITTCARTMVDMTNHLGNGDLHAMLADVLRRRLCTPASLRAVTDRLAADGRPWVRRLTRLLDGASVTIRVRPGVSGT